MWMSFPLALYLIHAQHILTEASYFNGRFSQIDYILMCYTTTTTTIKYKMEAEETLQTETWSS